MDLKTFVNNLSEKEFSELIDLVEFRKNNTPNIITITDFIEEYKFEISPRLLSLLKKEAKETKYVNRLLRAKLHRYKTIGSRTIMELEFLLRKANIDSTYFYSQPRIYLNDLDLE